MSKIMIICGATASGKSDRAIAIAREMNGVIINADAMQVYHEMRILTARPTPVQEAQSPHLLYGIVSAAEKFSVAKWLAAAAMAIKEVQAQNRLAIVTGGTGLYIRALMEGLSPIPSIPPEIRLQAQTIWQQDGANALQRHDPAMAARLKPGDTQRHIRALEVMLATGKSLLYWQAIPRIPPFPDSEFLVDYISVERTELYARCNARFLTMLEGGALEEAGHIKGMGLNPDMPAHRTLGLPELMAFLDDRCSLQEATIKAQQATRNYAKRQITWFNHQLP